MNDNTFKSYANSFQAIARLRLESIERLLHHLGNPQNDLKFIHIAGTNGKGSVCSFLQCIFTDADYKTGKYTSPNLVKVAERISIDGALIDDAELDSLLNSVQESAEKVKAEQGELPTQFEIWTAAALCYFKAKKCDIVILETGLGGTRDATNIIPPPLASVITRLDLDHTEYLGNTLTEIATEKAGIIKAPLDNATEGLTVTSPQTQAAMSVLAKVCKNRHNRLLVADIPEIIKSQNFHEIFNYKNLNSLECGITGFYQPENAALAVETALALGIDEKFIHSGLKKATNPARFEIIQNDPVVIYDGAHNKNGINTLIESIHHYFPHWQGATFIMAFMGDKDIDGSFSALKDSGLMDNSEVFAVKVNDNPRAAEAEVVCEIAKNHRISSTPFKDLKNAYTLALKKNKPTVICGSLYLYKDFYEIIKK
ncbi:MAG: bifunctional folylpolyglutamate synthase/dihydrofolate synthase [Ruminococcaceae bacterium]|nr:bifunctional folylpolyglutamate synthase/dihydrofolate synthase [Oscillospiraceae bacterium]